MKNNRSTTEPAPFPALTLGRKTAKAKRISELRKMRGEKRTGKTDAKAQRKKKRSEKFARLALELIKSEAYLNLTTPCHTGKRRSPVKAGTLGPLPTMVCRVSRPHTPAV